MHTLQLVLGEAVFAIESTKTILSIGRKIVSHFKHSALACHKLSNIQNQLNLTKKTLVQDVITRWNSSFYMMERLQEERRALTIYCIENENKFHPLIPEQWEWLQQLLFVLKPFEQITKNLSSNEAIISETIPTVMALKKFVSSDLSSTASSSTSNAKIFENLSETKKNILKSLNKRFDNILQKECLIVASFLDPRFKIAFFGKDNNVLCTVQCILENQEKRTISSPQLSVTANENECQTNIDRSEKNLWDCFDEIAESSTYSIPDCSKSDSILHDEIMRYNSEKLLDRKESPLIWWNKKKEIFPKLARYAQMYLCGLASSVYSERLFSEAGNLYEEKSKRLTPEKGEKLIFLHHNLPLLNFKYDFDTILTLELE